MQKIKLNESVLLNPDDQTLNDAEKFLKKQIHIKKNVVKIFNVERFITLCVY